MLQLWLPGPTLLAPVLLVPTLLASTLPVPTSHRGAGGISPWMQSSQFPPALVVRGTWVLVPTQCVLGRLCQHCLIAGLNVQVPTVPCSHALAPGKRGMSQGRGEEQRGV